MPREKGQEDKKTNSDLQNTTHKTTSSCNGQLIVNLKFL